jgi:Nucleotidyl transferase AbiEii toxin, Type IV TA system
MRGVSEAVEEVLTVVSELDVSLGFTLIGGTALSLSIAHCLSEDIDLCTWDREAILDPEKIVENIRAKRKDFRISQKLNSEFHLDFLINEVKVTFFKDPSGFVPQFEKEMYFNKIRIADVHSIAGMKACVALNRSKFRDYYDLFCLAHDHISIRDILGSAISLRPHLNPRLILQNITSLSEAQDEKIDLLKPIYKISGTQIEVFFKAIISPAGLGTALREMNNILRPQIIQGNVEYHREKEQISTTSKANR